MFSNLGFKNSIGWLMFIITLVILILFAENIYNNQRCKKLDIQLERDIIGHFLDKAEIEKLVTNNGNNPILGTKFNLLNLRMLERSVLINKLVKSCQIKRTLGGNLVIKVTQQNPIARIISQSASSDRFAGLYLGESGQFLPLSGHFTKKVMLVSGAYFVGKSNLKAEKDKNLIEFISKINQDPFWNANMTHLIVDEDQNMSFLPLVGDYTFEYGMPKAEDFETKLNKIKIFYKKIDPQNIDKYKMISVKFQNQIVCQLKSPPTI